MEENKVAQITKHSDSSRSTDSGVSGKAQTRAREIRCDWPVDRCPRPAKYPEMNGTYCRLHQNIVRRFRMEKAHE